MATAKKPVSKPVSKNATAKAAKKSAPVAPKPSVSKNKPAAKVAASSSTNKKAAPVAATPKKSAPAKAPAKKSTVLTKTTSKSSVTSKAPEVKAKAPAKKAAAPTKSTVVAKPAPKKAEVPAKKAAAPVKAVAAPAKKAAVASPAKKAEPVAPAKKVAVAPVAKPAAPAKKEKVAAKKPVSSKTIAAIVAKQTPVPKPSPAPAAYIGREEKKSNVIIAHRRLESKANTQEESGKTMINYQPDFTRSILSSQTEEKTGPVYRYSDEELMEFKELIQGRLETARKELSYQQGLITRKDEAGTEDTENRYMNMEDGSGAMEREQLAQLASRQIQFINHLEKALIRIENKTYGICRVTGNLIDKARLRAVPHATLSIEAKKQMNK
jgi:RNA polymerase-binding transcription factor DksA